MYACMLVSYKFECNIAAKEQARMEGQQQDRTGTGHRANLTNCTSTHRGKQLLIFDHRTNVVAARHVLGCTHSAGKQAECEGTPGKALKVLQPLRQETGKHRRAHGGYSRPHLQS
jgi:hypothetical protein